MRSIALMGTAAAVLTAVTLVAAPANAERVCRQVCDGGVCKSRCVERGDRLFMQERDIHRRPGVELRRPGVDIDVHRRRGVDIDVRR
jgi:hypothetical protein